MKSTRLLSIPVYFLFGIALLISAGCKKTPGSSANVTYTISFDKNGGIGDPPAAITFTHSQENLTAPEKPTGLSATAGQDFAGWNTRSDGSGENYAANALLNTLTAVAQDATLYARWKGWEVSTIAGGSSHGTANGPGTDARFHNPYSVALDKDGNIYVADSGNDRIRKITTARVVSTIAGSSSGTTNATGTAAQFRGPSGVAVYSPDVSDRSKDIIYVADTFNDRIRKITATGVVSTLAATGGFSQKADTVAGFSSPYSVAVDSSGNIYVADSGNHRIRKITPAGVVSTFAGSRAGYKDDATGTKAQFYSPAGVAVDKDDNIYVADTYNHRIRKITTAGVVTTIAGGSSKGYRDDTGTAALFDNPFGVAVDSSGNIYVADQSNHRIRKITPEKVVSTIAGGSSNNQPESGTTDATGTDARFYGPSGVAVDSSGNIYVTDTFNHRIRKMEYK